MTIVQKKLFYLIGLFGLLLVLVTTAQAGPDLLQQVKNEGRLTVGTEARFKPFEFVQDGQIVGYSADIMRHIMQQLPDVELVRRDVPWQGILPGLESGRFDYVVTSVVATPKRREKYHLSLPIATASMALLKRSGDDSIQSPQDIGGKVVGSQTGSAQLAAVKAFNKTLRENGKPAAKIRSYTDFNQAYADLAQGRLDAVANGLPNLMQAAQTRPEIFAVVRPTFGPKKYYAWAGRKDAESQSLNQFFDRQLRRLNDDGTLAELQKKWFGQAMSLPTERPEPQ